MPMRVVNAKKFWSSLIFLFLGIGIALQGQTYALGTAMQMGPGYFPTLLGGLLAVLGGVGVVTACRGLDVVAVGRWPLLPLLFISAALVGFAILITTWGLLAAVLCLVSLSCYTRLRRNPVEVLVIFAAMSAVTYGIFVYLLQLPIELT